MNNRQKQLRFSIILCIVIAVCIGGGILLRLWNPLAKLPGTAGPTYTPYGTEGSAMQLDNPSSVEAQAHAGDTASSRPQTGGSTAFSEKAGTLLAQCQTSAEPVEKIYTTKRAVAFSFSGLGNSRELSNVLDALAKTGSIGTFYVSREETEQYPDDVAAIIRAGMAMGILYDGGSGATGQSLLCDWLQAEENLRQAGYIGTLSVMQNFGTPAEAALKAAAAGGYSLISPRRDATPAAAAFADSAQQIIDINFPKGKTNLQLGETVHFRMNFLQYSDSLLGEAVTMMAVDKSNYPVIPVTDILADTESQYTYPLPHDQILPEVVDAIYPGQLKGDNTFETLRKRYYGVSWVRTSFYLPGFTREEVNALDKAGLIVSPEKKVFITVDDWGTDWSIEPMLQVLAKHNAKATFFIRTNHVASNPNLLRRMAEDGHLIGSHTDSHFPLSNATDTKVYESLTDKQVIELQEDLVRSYNTLQSIVGDCTIDDGPALTRIFRPPTLAMSKVGLRTVLDCGFTYSVSGSGEAQDYLATSAEQLAQELVQDTVSGAVIILHMFENAPYTAEALDIYLTRMEQSGAGFEFVTLANVLK